MIEQIASYYNMPIELMLNSSREKRLVLARQMASTILKEKKSLTYREIGEIFNQKPHNIFYAYNKIKNKTLKRGKIRNDYLTLMKIL